MWRITLEINRWWNLAFGGSFGPSQQCQTLVAKTALCVLYLLSWPAGLQPLETFQPLHNNNVGLRHTPAHRPPVGKFACLCAKRFKWAAWWKNKKDWSWKNWKAICWWKRSKAIDMWVCFAIWFEWYLWVPYRKAKVKWVGSESANESWNSLTGGGAQIRPHPAVAMALILTVVDN